MLSKCIVSFQYFYGTRAAPLYPHTFEIAFDEVQICKIGGERLPIECLPFAIDQTVLTTNVFGFLVITGVDMARRTFTVLSPQPYPLPSKILILSEVTFVDDKERT
ncbi:unnamed protein product [Gongylonema pulchrum]|uniref:Clp1 domain-containing protein n=1 Tax=Gongylonema pulchrum TaxID=637853 RepID=A0A183ETB6_9BILA|nr:unnamed protein product [Gongylonema pulchrum]